MRCPGQDARSASRVRFSMILQWPRSTRSGWKFRQVCSSLRLAAARPAALDSSGVDTRATSRSRSEEHTSELQSLMRISYAVFCLKKKKNKKTVMQNKHIKTRKTINTHDNNTTTQSKQYVRQYHKHTE